MEPARVVMSTWLSDARVDGSSLSMESLSGESVSSEGTAVRGRSVAEETY